MKVAFAGTPDFAATVLRALISSKHEVALVISQPDARRGRGRKTTPTPVAQLAHEHDIPLTQPARIGEVSNEISAQDALVVAAYGQILRPDTLHAAKHGAWNVHGSLLPKYRGAAPVERTIMSGETQTGATIIQMDEGLDTGMIACQRIIPLDSDATGGELRHQLAEIGAKAMVEVLSCLKDRDLRLRKQNNVEATYAAKISGEERVVKWGEEREEVRNKVRALSPHIGARTFHPQVEGPIKLWSAVEFRGTDPGLAPGEISAGNGLLLVGCADGALSLEELQLPGGRSLSAAEFLRGNGLDGSFST